MHIYIHTSAPSSKSVIFSQMSCQVSRRVKYSDKIATRYLTCKDTTFDKTVTHSYVGHFPSKDTMGWLR